MSMEVRLIHSFDPALERKLDRLINALETNANIGEAIMATLDDILFEVEAETSVTASVAALIANLQANQNDPAKLDQILTGMKANAGTLAAALTANQAPQPTPLAAA
jgi:hypothetical protein